VILTYEKHNSLKKLIDIYGYLDYKILILDGSRMKLNYEVSKELRKKISYIHWPGKNTYLQRLCFALSVIDTQYFLLLDDEDLVIPHGISAAIYELDLNPSLSAVSGRTFFVNHQGLKPRVQPWGKWYSNLRLDSDTTEERIVKCFESDRGANVYYAIQRTTSLENLASLIQSRQNLNNWVNSAELIMILYILSQGKYIQIESNFLIRNGTRRTLTSKQRRRKRITDRDIDSILDVLSKIAKDTISLEQVKIVLRNFHQTQKASIVAHTNSGHYVRLAIRRVINEKYRLYARRVGVEMRMLMLGSKNNQHTLAEFFRLSCSNERDLCPTCKIMATNWLSPAEVCKRDTV